MSKQSNCVNCQIIGFQKAIDTMLKLDHKLAVKLAELSNRFIQEDPRFKQDGKHLIEVVIEKPLSKSFTRLVPRPYGPPARTREQLIRLFTCDTPHVLKYQRMGREGENHKADLPELKKLIHEGLVQVVTKDRTSMTYEYFPTKKSK